MFYWFWMSLVACCVLLEIVAMQDYSSFNPPWYFWWAPLPLHQSVLDTQARTSHRQDEFHLGAQFTAEALNHVRCARGEIGGSISRWQHKVPAQYWHTLCIFIHLISFNSKDGEPCQTSSRYCIEDRTPSLAAMELSKQAGIVFKKGPVSQGLEGRSWFESRHMLAAAGRYVSPFGAKMALGKKR